MKDKILADTSVWVEFFKKGSEIGNRLASLIADDSVVICGVVLFELMQGVKSDTEKTAIMNAILRLPYIEMDTVLWQKSATLSASLRKNGVTVPVSDIFIAAIALEYDLPIFTLDKHFESIPGLKIYRF